MTPQITHLDISWEKFALCNTYPQSAFENMCRWIFNEFFFGGKGLLHSNPNNPGVEVEPILHGDSGKRISFQAKYFSSLDYEQIKHSAQTAISHYSGELDIIYLYCNKDVTKTSKGYKEVETILRSASIDLIPITNRSILDYVMCDQRMAWYYFDHVTLTPDWFKERLQTSLAALGPRYNEAFNVETNSEDLLNYFLCNQFAVTEINKRKNEWIDELRKGRSKYSKYSDVFAPILSALEQLEDVSLETIMDSLEWGNRIKSSCADAFIEIQRLIELKDQEYKEAEKEHNRDLVSQIASDRDDLVQLFQIPLHVIPDNYPRILMQHQIVIVKGEAGVGKSQLFAVAADKLLSEHRGVILLLGTNYLNNQSIFTQTPNALITDLSLDALLYKLEAMAVQRNTSSCIFIDAINESMYKNIWQVGLPQLFSTLQKYPHVRLAISVRSGYEKLVFDDSITSRIENSQIGSIVHRGFIGNSINATFKFLNYYGIPFLPSYFLQSEMANPLFLTLFCKTYSGENYDMYTLFEKLIEKADIESRKAIEQEDSIPILHHLVDEIAQTRLSRNTLFITQSELFKLDFWNTYGISNKKIQYTAALERSGLLIGTVSEESEAYHLGYNLLEDFVCAKAILKKYRQTPELISYLRDDFLEIKNGKITHYYNIDIFIVVCGLYADRFHSECFEEVFNSVSDEFDRDDLSQRYAESFIWRKASSVNSDSFLENINNHSVRRDIVFSVLIENSTKENHPLNAKFLHKLLKQKTLAGRDALWTTYINHLDSEARIYELIKYFDEGNILNGLSEQNTELLLIMLTWLLTSSNRFLRDKASKASIELLRRNFSLCMPLLQHFEGVNDPYVLQRLYGIVFGACVKRVGIQQDIFRDLAKYVYTEIFDKDYVYPDILLRDYARLILSRWQYEFPDDCEFMSFSRIAPPYNSLPIPTVEPQKYSSDGIAGSGFNRIDFSMRINHSGCHGLYGDFGRYTFQAALERFHGTDVLNLYHYAMQFIRDELGYSDILDEYDGLSSFYRHYRHDTKKIERIGKKYQWIAFYNILARISDTHLIKEWENDPLPFEGPWEPYVRDFDPTLNVNSLTAEDTPVISYPVYENEFLAHDPEPTHGEIYSWKDNEPDFFRAIPAKLRVSDSEGNKWIALYLYDCVKTTNPKAIGDSIGFTKGTQQIWLIAQAYFVTKDQLETVHNYVCSEKFSNSNFPEGSNVYQLFNREYPWAPGLKSIFKDPWVDFEIETGKYRVVREVYTVPDFEQIEHNEDGEISIPMVEKEFEKRIPEDTIHVQIMPSYSRVLWEEEYDASQEKATAFHIPCCNLIESLGLTQREADGYYYDQAGRLVCFDGSLAGQVDGLFFRADALEEFLRLQDIELVWTCIGEKQYFLGDLDQRWSRWSGYYHYGNGAMIGQFTINNSPE